MPKSLSDADNRLLAAKEAALALSEQVLSEESLSDMDGYKRKRKRGLRDSFKGFRDSLSGMGDDFGKNVSRNVGEVLNPIAARDVGFAIVGGVMYLLIPPALNIITRRNFDHNGTGGVAVGLGGALLIGLLTGNVPIIAGALSAFAAQAMYVLFDKQVLEPATGVRLARWDVKADSTIADSRLADGGIYDNQPFPREIEIDGVRGMAYSYEDMIKELENGNSVKLLAKQGESVNHLADDENIGDSKNDLFARMEHDESGNVWGVLPDGLKLLLDEAAEPALVDGNFLAHNGTEVFAVDMELKRIPQQPYQPASAMPAVPEQTTTIAESPMSALPVFSIRGGKSRKRR